jgi:formylglycine-generating enzyme required for sulfatase activity
MGKPEEQLLFGTMKFKLQSLSFKRERGKGKEERNIVLPLLPFHPFLRPKMRAVIFSKVNFALSILCSLVMLISGCDEEQTPVGMVLIPAGTFQMGSDKGDVDELPIHTVYLDAFYIDEHEVTNEQYKKFVRATGHSEPEGLGYTDIYGELKSNFKPWDDLSFNQPNQPVVCVSWDDAVAYAKWAGKRLPTEAEWEKAARGGLVDMKYPWGDDEPDDNKANFADRNTNFDWSDKSVDDGYIYPAPVGSYFPNVYGLYDMAGNVWEWCADWYDETYYNYSPQRNPTGPDTGTKRVLRGGSWYRAVHTIRCAERVSDVPTNSLNIVGFRCVKEIR